MTGKNMNFAFAVAPVGTIGLSDAQLYEEVITDCRLGYSLGYLLGFYCVIYQVIYYVHFSHVPRHLSWWHHL